MLRIVVFVQQANVAGAILTVTDDLYSTLNRQLYCILGSLTSVAKAPRREGLSAQRFATMLRNIIGFELPDPVVMSLGELEMLTKEHTDQSDRQITDNVERVDQQKGKTRREVKVMTSELILTPHHVSSTWTTTNFLRILKVCHSIWRAASSKTRSNRT